MAKTHIVIHHSFTDDSQTVSWKAIERYHRDTNGWRDIGYHYGVERIGDDYYALVGRPEQDDAAAVKEQHMNEKGIHVCCVGNYDSESPPVPMLECLITRIILPVMSRYNIPIERIRAHHDYAIYKTCPGKKFDMDILRTMVAKWPSSK